MIDTRLLGSGAFGAIALMLAAAATPASAAAQASPDMMIAPDSGMSPISAPAAAPAPTAALQDRGRGGGGRGDGGRAMRSGNTGGWNGAQSRASGGGDRGGGRNWGGGRPSRQVEAGGAPAARGGGYDRGARSYPGNAGGYAGNGGNYAGSGYARPERGGAGARSDFARDRAAINRGDIQAPPSYGEGNRSNAASPYIRNDNLAAQGVTVGGGAGDGNFSDRRGGGRVGVPGEVRGGGRDNAWRGDGRRGNWGDGRRGNWGDDRRGDWGDGRRDNWRGDRRGDWRGNDGWRGNRNDFRDNRNAFRGGRQFGYNQGFRDGFRWDRGWRNNNRFNWFGHRQANRFLFAPGPYFSPFAGHFYRPVGIGFALDPLFFQPRFFLNDPWAFRLPPPGDRFRWVRYYDDVLLVDIFSGEVVDVIENFFWQ
jgi:hypothetical protein